MTSENVIGIRSFSESLSCQSVVEEADKFIQRNFVSISASEEFLQLGLTEILNLLRCDGLNVESEEQVSFTSVKSVCFYSPNFVTELLTLFVCFVP